MIRPWAVLVVAWVALVFAGSLAAASGLAEAVGASPRLAPAAALQLLAGGPGALDVRWRPVGAEKWEGGLHAWRRTGDGLAAGDATGLLTGALRVSEWHGALRLNLMLTATRAAAAPTEVVVRCPFEPAAWQRQFIPRLPYLQLPPGSPALLRFAADANDATTFTQAPQVALYPFGVLDSDRAFVLWGAPDVGRYAVLSPNLISASAPCLSLRPKRLQPGQRLSFDLVLKRFARPECRYRDVLRWYLRSAFSSDPLVADLFPWDGKPPARRFSAGNLGHGLGRLTQPDLPPAQALDELVRQRRVGPIWFQGWGPWDETYPTAGSWLTEFWFRTSAEQVRAEIAWERANGMAPLMYCRQFLAEQGVHDDRPPYRDWVGRDENGDRMAWADYPVPEAVAKELGFAKLQQSCADFGHPGYLRWYEERVKACVDFYQPGGIAWDMGWGAGLTWGYSRGNPRVFNGDGMLRAQADLWAWLRQRHPDMRVIANEAIGTPSQLFADGILIEGGFASGKTELDYEAAKAIGTTIVSFEYPHLFAAQLKGLSTARARYLQFRYRAVGVNTQGGRYVVYPSQEIVGKEGPALTCSDLVADGAWHTAVYDMKGLPNVEELKGLAFGFDAAADEAHLYVSALCFSATPDGPPLPNEPGCFPASLADAGAAAWEARPGWVQNAPPQYSVRCAEGILDFSLHGAGKGMSWSFFPAGADLAQEYLRAVALGSSIGAGLRAGWDTLNAFSAQTMALAPLVGSHDLEVSPASAGLNASAWGERGRLLVAAHNGTDAAQRLALSLRPEALRGTGAQVGSGCRSLIMARNAETVRPGPAATVTSRGLQLTVELAPGEALLWGNWAWQ